MLSKKQEIYLDSSGSAQRWRLPVFFMAAVLLATGLLPTVSSHAYDNASFQAERESWRSALIALRAGNTKAYDNASPQLRSYVLWPFLEYEMLKRRLSKLSLAEVEQFSAENESSVVGRALRQRYLSVLASQSKWKQYLSLSDGLPLDTKNSCLRLRARLKQGETVANIDDAIASIWNHGRSLPDACDPLFSNWHKSGAMTSLRVLERIESAIKVGNPKLVKYLSRTWLPAADRKWAERWIKMRENPVGQLAKSGWNTNSAIANPILRYGIRRAALRDYDTAESKVSEWFESFGLDAENQAQIVSKIGMAAATDFHLSAMRWLARVPDLYSDATVRQWRIRSALRQFDFKHAGEYIERLTVEEQQQPKWRYWRARVLARSGNSEAARQIYAELAATRNFYGFLAADIIDSDYVMNHAPIPNDDVDLARVAQLDGLHIARELFLSGETILGRQQWAYTTRRLTTDDKQRAAIMAHRWGWHDRAIITAGRSGYTNDLDIRFPLLHRELVEKHARQQRIDPGWVYGVVRQESAFNPEARSSVGALGLMQLMPATGRRVGKKINLPVKSNKAILDVKNNINLGTAYLRMVLDRNRGHVVLATASYNAGPHKVVRWLPESDQMPADIWIETIPYSETRNFVKNVLAFMTVYETRMGGDQPRLGERLPGILSPEKQTLVSQ